MKDNSKPYLDIDKVSETIDAVKKNRGLAKVTFCMHGKSAGGVALESETGAITQNGVADDTRRGQFKLISDEPVPLLGTDLGVSPAEYALKSLASCYTVTLTSMAAAKGIQLDEIEMDLYFDVDLSGFLGIDSSVRNGAQGIRVDVRLKSENTDSEALKILVDSLPSHSPLHDTLANPVSITTRMV
ncbi:OsmC family protein [Allopusillimonas ginsengisoli]|uniref:OsmC family protein n=1 Tax=Allopusillimonas ginsengisoli TaxID=453575 RepID=UPI00101E97AA|nr:OsmC family protein [Allopusillimonas ginsengisoli]TEA80005.1 OsmC family peroxiredoxin [Allopusillimonas ginsengisoli]